VSFAPIPPLAGAAVLGKALASNTHIEILYLADNRIGDVGATALATVLASPGSVLTTLGLSSNHVGDEGAVALATALSGNGALTALELNGNAELGDRGVSALAAVLGRPTCAVQQFSCANTGFGSAGVHALAAALTTNQSLWTLDMADAEGGCDVAAHAALVKALRANTTLSYFSGPCELPPR
jgi:hypothetical protein